MNIEFSKEALEVVDWAVEYATQRKLELLTPEIILMGLCEDATFISSLKNCDVDPAELQELLISYVDEYIDKSDDAITPETSTGLMIALQYAYSSAQNSGTDIVGIPHILSGIWNTPESYAVYYMKSLGLDKATLLSYVIDEGESEMDAADEGEIDSTRNDKKKAYKEAYRCINDDADRYNPLIGREDELQRTIQVLCRKDKNNPLYIGEPGVGKTALVYGLAQKLNSGEVPELISESKIFELDLGNMLAGTQYRGDFEKRLKKVLKEIGKEKQPIIFIDEIHNLTGAGAVGESSYDASNMLKPYLNEDHIRFIGATTYEEYKKHFEKNKGVIWRFQNIEIKEPSEEETVDILKGLKDKYEAYHSVEYADGVIEYAVSMSAKYINERFLPDKAIDLIDEAGAYRKLNKVDGEKPIVSKDDIARVLTKICRIPIETVKTEENEGLATLEERIKEKIFGQDEAIGHAVNAIKFSKAGLLESDKPLASLLFVGPTGVGKTEVARSLAEEMGIKLLRFDMSEYEEKHAVAKLIGAPAGYVGYEEGGLLTEGIRKNPHCVLLLDEIEKAHADIYNVLLSIMDYATLTDNQGRKADFRNVIVIMTSNAGASRIGKQGIGFSSESLDSGVIMDEVKRVFQPEFRNRLNRIVVFNGMDDNMAERVIEKKLSELSDQLSAKSIEFKAEDKAISLIKKRGISNEYGAREIDRVIRNDIKPLFVDEILFGKLKNGGKLTLTAENGEFSIRIG
ncbi:MAG: AAA family ATPase [Lachnospiraceae bacterium]|nr:AAA family ATPase [Lachnospiraceae bacterium]